MRFFLDLAPWACFAIAFWITGELFTATIVLIPSTIVQVGLMWLFYRKVEKLHLVTLVAVLVFGGATLLFQEGRFIQWKPTVVNYILAIIFFISILWKPDSPLPKKLLGDKINLPGFVWSKLTWAWIFFFLFSGTINIAVAYAYSEEAWVNFKLFGQMAITIAFVIGQTIYIARHIPKEALTKQ